MQMGLDLRRIHHVFLTHHHYDHTADMPCFALTRWDKGREDQPPLAVYGPPPTRNFMTALFDQGGAFFEDCSARVTSPTSLGYYQLAGGKLPRPRPTFDVREVNDGSVIGADGWSVTCFNQTGVRERVLATIGGFYKGSMLMPDELTSIDLGCAN